MWKIIKDFDRYSVSPCGDVRNNSTKRILKHILNNKGYHKVSLYNNSGMKQVYVHRLVATNFIENTDGCKQVNHKDDNKDNNHINNLYWGTQSQNIKDCYANGYVSDKRKLKHHQAIFGNIIINFLNYNKLGLDMYLTKRKYVGANYEHRNVTGTIDIKIDKKPLPIKLSEVSEIIMTAGYWRKSNQIHNWFVQNVQDGKDECQESYVSHEKLQELLNECKEVKHRRRL